MDAPLFVKTDSSARRIGLLAGWGRYPIIVAEALKRAGYEIYCLGIRDHADPKLAEICADFDWLGLARLGKAVRYFRRHGLNQAVMAGKIHKVRLFDRGAWRQIVPDWLTVRTFAAHFITLRRDRKDDTLLSAITATFARSGITLRPATDFAPELLVNKGCLTRRRPTAGQEIDIWFGWELAKELGRLDIGQSVVVKGQAALAVEAIEGTDACIRRAGELCRSGEFVVVKVAKPQQDMRFDVPTIGLGTLETLVAAGGAVLAIEAGRTIVLDEPQLVDFANRHGLVVVAVDAADAQTAKCRVPTAA